MKIFFGATLSLREAYDIAARLKTPCLHRFVGYPWSQGRMNPRPIPVIPVATPSLASIFSLPRRIKRSPRPS